MNIFFWGGYFSNFADLKSIKYKDIEFSTSEQIFMFEKAMFFGDEKIAQQIVEDGSNPKVAKRLGRKVAGFNESEWAKVREEKMLAALRAKFSVPFYRKILLDSGNDILVEASPFDRIWGIGFDKNHAVGNESNWGLNLLGKCLMQVREEIKLEEEKGENTND